MPVWSVKTLANAKEAGQEWANRDGCDWIIWKGKFDSDPYLLSDEFNPKPWNAAAKIQSVRPSKADDPRGTPVYLTEEEKKIVAAVLHPDEPGRDYFPGSEEAKLSLRFKLLGFELDKSTESDIIYL